MYYFGTTLSALKSRRKRLILFRSSHAQSYPLQNGGKNKRQSRPQKRLVNEYLQVSEAKKKKEKSGKDNQLYEIEIMKVDKEKKKVKIQRGGG